MNVRCLFVASRPGLLFPYYKAKGGYRAVKLDSKAVA